MAGEAECAIGAPSKTGENAAFGENGDRGWRTSLSGYHLQSPRVGEMAWRKPVQRINAAQR